MSSEPRQDLHRWRCNSTYTGLFSAIYRGPITPFKTIVRAHLFEAPAIKASFALKPDVRHGQSEHCVTTGYISIARKFTFYPPSNPRGAPNKMISVTAEALPFGKYNKTKQTWVSFELTNCLPDSLHEPRQMHHGQIESAACP